MCQQETLRETATERRSPNLAEAGLQRGPGSGVVTPDRRRGGRRPRGGAGGERRYGHHSRGGGGDRGGGGPGGGGLPLGELADGVPLDLVQLLRAEAPVVIVVVAAPASAAEARHFWRAFWCELSF
jgi:hypothetical protein